MKKTTRKLLSSLVALSLTATAFAGFTWSVSAASATAGEIAGQNVYYDEDFEGYTVGTLAKQGTSLVSVLSEDGKFTYNVNPRGSGGGDTGFYIGETTEPANKYLISRSGRWSSNGRNAYIDLNNAPSTAEIGEDQLVVDFDAYFRTDTLIDFKNGLIIKPDSFGVQAEQWYNIKVVVNGLNFTVYTVKDGALVHTEQGTLTSAEFVKAEFTLVDNAPDSMIDNFKIYTIADAVQEAVLTFKDDAGNPINGVTVTGLTVEDMDSDTAGEVQVELPVGTYTFNVICDGYFSETYSIEIGGTAFAQEYTLRTRETPQVTRIEIAGGQEIVYRPDTGVNVTEPFTAAVYDQNGEGYLMPDEKVVWSISPETEGVAVDADTGIVSVNTDAVIDGQIDVNVVATSVTDSNVSAQKSITVRDTAVATEWKIAGPAAIKQGETKTYTITDVKDQFGADLRAEDYYFELSSDSEFVQVNGKEVTANAISGDFETVTLKTVCENVTNTRDIKIHNIYFYEPGLDQAITNITDARFDKINDETVFVWPDAANADKTSKITLDTAVPFENGKAIEFSGRLSWTVKETATVLRSFDILDSNGASIFAEGSIGLSNSTFGFGSTKADGVNFSNTIDLGSLGAYGEWVDFSLIVKTDAAGNRTGVINLNGKETTVVINGADISAITFTGKKGGPGDRLLSMRDIAIKAVTVADVAISGDNLFAKISGQDVTRTYKESLFGSMIDGETFTWAVSPSSDAVTIDANGVLTVKDTATPGTYTVSITSSLIGEKPERTASYDVEIKDFAGIENYNLEGPAVLTSGDTGKYRVSNIIDEYGDTIVLPVTWSATGADISADGVLTTTSDTKDVTVTASLGNPGKEMVKTMNVTVGNFTAKIENPTSTEVDVSKLINYGSNEYKVVTKTAEGVQITKKTAVDGKVTLDTIEGVQAAEVMPVYKFDLGSASEVEAGMTGVSAQTLFADNGYGFTDSSLVSDVTVPNGTAAGSDAVEFNTSFGSSFDIGLGSGNYYVKTMIGRNTTRVSVDLDGYKAFQDIQGTNGYDETELPVTDGVLNISAGAGKSDEYSLSYVEVTRISDLEVKKTQVFIGGDSTVCNYYPKDLQGSMKAGWGQVLDLFMPDDVIVKNYATSGQITTGFLEGGAFDAVEHYIGENDYFLLQLGINDSDKKNPTADQYKANIIEMVNRVRAKGAIPILITPQGRMENIYKAYYSEKLVEVSQEMDVILIDNRVNVGDYYAYLGGNSADALSPLIADNADGSKDKIHLSRAGALNIARITAEQLKAKLPEAFGDVKVTTGDYKMNVMCNMANEMLTVSEGKAKFTADAQGLDYRDSKITVMIAEYTQDGSLIKVNMSDVDLKGYTEATMYDTEKVEKEVTLDANTKIVKAMAWTSTGTQAPIIKVLTQNN